MNRLEAFLGGSVLGVLARLVVLSVVVGVVLAWLHVTPWSLLASLRRSAEEMFGGGAEAVRRLFDYFLLGAAVVVPLWLILRLVRAVPGQRR